MTNNPDPASSTGISAEHGALPQSEDAPGATENAAAHSAATPSHQDAAGPTEWFAHPRGVGPWEEEHPGQPRPSAPHFDPELLEQGDRRNVVDAYRYWRHSAIVADIDTRRHSLHIAIENFDNDSNIGTVVRTANAFAVDTVHIVGRKRWNRRGAMVTDRYQHLMHHPSVESVVDFAVKHGLTVVAVDNTPGSVPLETAQLPQHCLMLFGQEGPGVTPEAQRGASMTVSIAQFGSTRSINAGVAAGIAMHAWIRAHADLRAAW